MVTLGTAEFTYEVIENWAKVPPGWSFKEVGGVAADARDNVYVFSRGEHPVMVFDRADPHDGRRPAKQRPVLALGHLSVFPWQDDHR